MANYRYLLADLLTNQINAELPLTGVTFQQALNQAGGFSASLLMSDYRLTQNNYTSTSIYNLDYVTTPGRSVIYIERDGIIVYGGIIWSRTYDSSHQTMSLSGREFESYFERRRISYTTAFATGTDQFALVKTLIDNAQSQPYGNIGVVTSGIGLCGQGISSPYVVYDYEKRVVFDTVLDLSRQDTPYGFDFSIDAAYDSNKNIVKTMSLSYPRQGRSYTANAFAPMLEFPGSMLYYTYPEDGGSMANRVYGTGPGSNEGQYISTANNTVSLTAGYPLLEEVVSFTQIPSPLVVDSLTSAEVLARAKPVTVMTATWSPTVDGLSGLSVGPVFGEFQHGDIFRIRVTDDRFFNTFETALRLSKYDVRVGDSGAELITGQFVVPTY